MLRFGASKMLRVTCFFVVFLLLFAKGVLPVALAEPISYTDENGRVHFVEGIERVPPKYRGQALGRKPLPPISKYNFDAERYAPGMKDNRSQFERTFDKPSAQSVDVYVTSWCGYCKALEKYLKSHGVSYRRHDIENDREAAREHQALGGGGVPVIKIGTQVMHGFNEQAIGAALHIN